MQMSEARVFELMGRLHAENRALTDEIVQLRAALAEHRCPEPAAPAEAPVPPAKSPKKPKAE